MPNVSKMTGNASIELLFEAKMMETNNLVNKADDSATFKIGAPFTISFIDSNLNVLLSADIRKK